MIFVYMNSLKDRKWTHFELDISWFQGKAYVHENELGQEPYNLWFFGNIYKKTSWGSSAEPIEINKEAADLSVSKNEMVLKIPIILEIGMKLGSEMIMHWISLGRRKPL